MDHRAAVEVAVVAAADEAGVDTLPTKIIAMPHANRVSLAGSSLRKSGGTASYIWI